MEACWGEMHEVSPMGCINPNIGEEADCPAGSTWAVGAWNRNDCLGHGSACFATNWDEPKGMNEAKCNECAEEDDEYEWKTY